MRLKRDRRLNAENLTIHSFASIPEGQGKGVYQLRKPVAQLGVLTGSSIKKKRGELCEMKEAQAKQRPKSAGNFETGRVTNVFAIQ